MFKKLLICYIAIQMTAQSCTKGCLQCDADNEQCSICDHDKYFLANGECVAKQLSNCLNEVRNLVGGEQVHKCTECNSSNYLNAVTNLCESVPSASLTKVPQCAKFQKVGENFVCQICNSGYQTNVVSGETTCVENSIQNCLTIQQNAAGVNVCSQCLQGFFISDDEKSCVAISPISNCTGYTDYQCMSCRSGYFLNRNLYLRTPYSTLLSMLFGLTYSDTIRIQRMEVTCQANKDVNCLEAEDSYDVCKTCKAGYYLKNDKTCIINPVEVIPNCVTYSSNTKCVECVANKLKNATGSKCEDFKTVTHCEQYSQDATSGIAKGKCSKCAADGEQAKSLDTNNNSCKNRAVITDCEEFENDGSCKRCKDNGYVDTTANPDTCKTRTVVEGCNTYIIDQDKCQVCNDGLVFGVNNGIFDKLKCFPRSDNCKETSDSYTTSIDESDNKVTTCTDCMDGYFNVNGDCVNDDGLNCLVFNQNQLADSTNAQCETCKNGYALSSGTCNLSIPNENCDIFSQNTIHECTTCLNGFRNFNIGETCRTNFLATENCVTYDTSTARVDTENDGKFISNCTACKDGFFLDNNKLCQNLSENCKTGTSARLCTECNQDYGLFVVTAGTEVTCVKSQTYVTEYCQDGIAQDGSQLDWNELKCATCKKGAYPVNTLHRGICVKKSDYVTFFGAVAANMSQANCDQYLKGVGCILCSGDNVLKENACVDKSQCDTGVIKTIFVDEDGGTGFPAHTKSNVCKTSASATHVFSYAQDDAKALQCNQRNSDNTLNVITVIAPADDDFSSIYPDYESTNSFSDVFFFKTPLVECLLVTKTGAVDDFTIEGGTNLDLKTSIKQHCKFYQLNATVPNDTYVCISCKKNKRLSSDGTDNTCVDFTCNSNPFIGLDVVDQAILSCNRCQNSDEVLVKYVFNTAGKFTFTKFNLDQAGAYTAQDDNTDRTFSSVCIQPTDNELYKALYGDGTTVQANQTKVKFQDAAPTADSDTLPLHCATIIFDLSVGKTGADNDDDSVKCVTCKVGYKLTTTGLNQTCVAIDNCDSSSVLANSCSKCESGFNFLFDGGDEVDTDECRTQPTNANNRCLASKDVNGEEVCQVCKTGYQLNSADQCVTYIAPKCSNTVVRKDGVDLSVDSNLALFLVQNKGFEGCLNCETDYISVVQPDDSTQLISSPHCYNTDETVSNVEHCDNYQNTFDTGIKAFCETCSSNKTISVDRRYCGNSIPNCLSTVNEDDNTEALESQDCSVCKPGFGIYTDPNDGLKKCKNTISNCMTYIVQNSTDLTCSVCNDKFYKKDNKCHAIEIPYCDRANEQIINNDEIGSLCEDCEEGYYSFNKKQCFQIPTDYGCATASVDGNSFECNTCSQAQGAPLALITTTSNDSGDSTTFCQQYNQIANCEVYHSDSPANVLQFTCKQCKTGYFADQTKNGYECTERTIKDTQCKTYELDKDLCSECNPQYFLQTDKKSCVEFPTGNYQCASFGEDEDDKRICTSCNPSYFLKDGECVLPQNDIMNCSEVTQDENMTCTKCIGTMFLENKVPVTAENADDATNFKICKTQTTELTGCMDASADQVCTTCNGGYQLKTSTSNNTQIICEKVTGFDNCAVFNSTVCVTCKQNYYKVGAECSLVTNLVTNCISYDNLKQCDQCAMGYILSKDKKTCTENTKETNCAYAQMTTEQICSVCNASYEFNSNQDDASCVSQQGVKSTSQGCLLTQDPNENCGVCRPGYYQDKNSKCIDENPNPTDPGDEDGIDIARVLIGLMAFFLVF